MYLSTRAHGWTTCHSQSKTHPHTSPHSAQRYQTKLTNSAHNYTHSEEGEKFNIWVALLNLEAAFGGDTPAAKEASLTATFQKALPYCNQKKLYFALLGENCCYMFCTQSHGGCVGNRDQPQLLLDRRCCRSGSSLQPLACVPLCTAPTSWLPPSSVMWCTVDLHLTWLTQAAELHPGQHQFTDALASWSKLNPEARPLTCCNRLPAQASWTRRATPSWRPPRSRRCARSSVRAPRCGCAPCRRAWRHLTRVRASRASWTARCPRCPRGSTSRWVLFSGFWKFGRLQITSKRLCAKSCNAVGMPNCVWSAVLPCCTKDASQTCLLAVLAAWLYAASHPVFCARNCEGAVRGSLQKHGMPLLPRATAR